MIHIEKLRTDLPFGFRHPRRNSVQWGWFAISAFADTARYSFEFLFILYMTPTINGLGSGTANLNRIRA